MSVQEFKLVIWTIFIKLYSRSRSHFNVVGFTFCARSISSEPFERFIVNFTQMSLSVRRCAETMNRVCRLMVKVNFQNHGILLSARWFVEHMTQLWSLEVNVRVQGHGIDPWCWCLLDISRTLWKFFIKLHRKVPLSETVCRSNDSATKTLKGHGHISRSWDIFTLQFSVWLCLNDFLKNHSNASFVETLFRTDNSVTHCQGQISLKGNGIYPSISGPLHIFQTLCTMFV